MLEGMKSLVAASDTRDVQPRRPFVLDGTRLYVSRSHYEESSIADRLVHIARSGNLEVLLGGPGTGKTYTVARLLALLFASAGSGRDNLRVALAAPTGNIWLDIATSLQRQLGTQVSKVQ